MRILKWTYIGYVDAHINDSYQCQTYDTRYLLFERLPFLFFRTRKAKKIGDVYEMKYRSSQHSRQTEIDVQTWLEGGKVPTEIVRVKVEKPNLKVVK